MIPSISVILPVYNEKEDYLRSSIKSILNQTYSDFELIILDDGSTDLECLSLLNYYEKTDARIRLIHQKENQGLTKILNQGLRLAQAPYIARMDSDDIAHPRRFEKQIHFMRNSPDVTLCGTWAFIIDEDDKILGRQCGFTDYDGIKNTIITINSFIHSTWFFKKSAIIDIGGYSEKMLKAQDYELLLKMIIHYKVANIPEILLDYRVSDKSISFKNNKDQERYAIRARLEALRKYGYPKYQYLKMIRPLFFYLFIPSSVKKFLMRLLWKI